MVGDLYNRQAKLNLNIPQKVTVIGCGGIGSWVALNMALIGVRKIILIDPDTIEIHNLNRTPFTLAHIDLPKVEALAELIFERRDDCEVLPIQKRLEDLNELEIEEIKDSDFIIDCRDRLAEIPFEHNAKVVKLGYDGFMATIHLNPSTDLVLGEGNQGYEIIPSWLGTPQLLAALITVYICCPELHDSREKIRSFDVRKLFGSLFNKKRR